MTLCPCGSGHLFIKCCKPFITGKALPKTAEQLMRSRYVAYTRANVDYIANTQIGSAAQGFDKIETKQWAQSVKWLGLKVLKVVAGTELEQAGNVEFKASYKLNGKLQTITENSLFHKINDQWFYVGFAS
jgi:SEC-C motif-containing protein